ncbi:IS110 family transposase [Longispora sp. NPDC051575]|uniref:IS110 family transposase n=1 Tax=Longispora sp. NPDC051575 TaxID=3154943 RepID=UPI0034189771
MIDTCAAEVIGGVDTHADTHTAAALDQLGRLLGTAQFPTTPAGYMDLLGWLSQYGPVSSIGVEGTGSYGAGLARFLRLQGVTVIEVDRPNRRMRRRLGKSDPVDAEAAARAVLSGIAEGVPKSRDGRVEAIRVIRTVRATAVKSRTAALNALVSMIRSAPDQLREQLDGMTHFRTVQAATRLRPGCDLVDPIACTKIALRRLARRVQHLDAEIKEAELELKLMVAEVAPDLLARPGIGPNVAAQLLVTAGDNPERIRNERAFAMLCGVAPIAASSGRTDRHRLNRGGDRGANFVLHIVALNRLKYDERTRAYAERRKAEGLSHLDVMRCLKRYIAREVFALLRPALAVRNTVPLPLTSTDNQPDQPQLVPVTSLTLAA